ncbi:MAG: HAMP domain-containing protein [Myxococcaceae bacterium]|jgi:two-component system sensor histidine kinase BaeS|nr:HAMP domain-containing protein [Myxococcaceae bacterium]MCA3013612.1 HAMP domain-containing protein [Myxococcaceae bacterium]
MRLVHRISLAFLATVLLVVMLTAASGNVSIERAFSRYLREFERERVSAAAPRLEAVWAADGDFGRLVDDPRLFGRLLSHDEPLEPRRPRHRPAPPNRPPPHSLHARATLYDALRVAVVGSGDGRDELVPPLRSGDAVVGHLGVRAVEPFAGALDATYLATVREHLTLIALLASAVGVAMAQLIARHLLGPIDALSSAARRLASGDYEARVGLAGTDELARLGRDFDALAQTLSDDARARRQWVADTSHELRTPLTVLRGELEALLDGVRPLDRAALESLSTEVARLQRLAEDLGELARSDRGELSLSLASLSPLEVPGEVVAHFRPRFAASSLTLDVTPTEGPWRVKADRVRLGQVFTNLLENSLRYTDAGGRLEVSTRGDGGRLVMRFDDTAPGLPPEALPRLFERFFRAEPSRSRARGGAGLGLAISQRLTEAHGGTLRALPSPIGGLPVELTLPLAEEGA